MENESFNDNKFRNILSKNITAKISSVGKELIEFRSNFQQSAQTIIDNVSVILNSVEDEKLRSKLRTLDEALKEISQKLTQVDILACFLDKAALFAPRVAFFVIKSGSIVGWQARGFEGDFNNDSIKSLIFSPGSDNLL